MGLIIRSSSIHAAGCYTTAPIAKGTRVVEYTGPLIGKEEADRRYEIKPITYLLNLFDLNQLVLRVCSVTSTSSAKGQREGRTGQGKYSHQKTCANKVFT